jgi:hypothetical protein
MRETRHSGIRQTVKQSRGRVIDCVDASVKLEGKWEGELLCPFPMLREGNLYYWKPIKYPYPLLTCHLALSSLYLFISARISNSNSALSHSRRCRVSSNCPTTVKLLSTQLEYSPECTCEFQAIQNIKVRELEAPQYIWWL